MKFKIKQTVIYEGRNWIITGSYTDKNGEVTYYIKRGKCRKTAREDELEK